MGYRSDIRIVTSKTGFEKLTEFVENYLKERDLDAKEYNLLESPDIKLKGKEQYYLGWNWKKWDEGDCPKVDAIMDGINYLGENEYSYRYMRIGESYDDIERQDYDGEKDKEICLEYPNMIREFDDEYIKNLLEDKKIENPEENKDEIGI